MLKETELFLQKNIYGLCILYHILKENNDYTYLKNSRLIDTTLFNVTDVISNNKTSKSVDGIRKSYMSSNLMEKDFVNNIESLVRKFILDFTDNSDAFDEMFEELKLPQEEMEKHFSFLFLSEKEKKQLGHIKVEELNMLKKSKSMAKEKLKNMGSLTKLKKMMTFN